MEFEGSIVGLPRSRTYWFSRLLTHGDIHCFHDYHSYEYDIPPDKRLFNSSCSPWNKQTGRLVIVHRDRDEAEASFKQFQNDTIPDIEVTRAFNLGAAILPKWSGLHVAYNDINDRIYEILLHIGVSFPSWWVDSMLTHNLQSTDNGVLPHKVRYRRPENAQRSFDL